MSPITESPSLAESSNGQGGCLSGYKLRGAGFQRVRVRGIFQVAWVNSMGRASRPKAYELQREARGPTRGCPGSFKKI